MNTYEEYLNEDALPGLQKKWEHEDTTNSERTEILDVVQSIALHVSEDAANKTCVYCKEILCYLPHDEAVGQGHVYSHDGLNEVRITGMCEWCFDIATLPVEDF